MQRVITHSAIAVRPAPSKNVDETGWKQAGSKSWLWVAVTASATLFVIGRRRPPERGCWELSHREFAALVEAECRPRVLRWLELGWISASVQ
jgi:hypothetical protein